MIKHLKIFNLFEYFISTSDNKIDYDHNFGGINQNIISFDIKSNIIIEEIFCNLSTSLDYLVKFKINLKICYVKHIFIDIYLIYIK